MDEYEDASVAMAHCYQPFCSFVFSPLNALSIFMV